MMIDDGKLAGEGQEANVVSGAQRQIALSVHNNRNTSKYSNKIEVMNILLTGFIFHRLLKRSARCRS